MGLRRQYLARLSLLLDGFGVLLAVDECMTALRWDGRALLSDYLPADIQPHLITLSKACGYGLLVGDKGRLGTDRMEVLRPALLELRTQLRRLEMQPYYEWTLRHLLDAALGEAGAAAAYPAAAASAAASGVGGGGGGAAAGGEGEGGGSAMGGLFPRPDQIGMAVRGGLAKHILQTRANSAIAPDLTAPLLLVGRGRFYFKTWKVGQLKDLDGRMLFAPCVGLRALYTNLKSLPQALQPYRSKDGYTAFGCHPESVTWWVNERFLPAFFCANTGRLLALRNLGPFLCHRRQGTEHPRIVIARVAARELLRGDVPDEGGHLYVVEKGQHKDHKVYQGLEDARKHLVALLLDRRLPTDNWGKHKLEGVVSPARFLAHAWNDPRALMEQLGTDPADWRAAAELVLPTTTVKPLALQARGDVVLQDVGHKGKSSNAYKDKSGGEE